MDIPYTTKPRPDTGLYNAKVGIWLFLASEVMLFGALFSSYILLRVGADPGTWPMGLLNVPIGTFNTAVLIISSMTVIQAWASLKMGNLRRFKGFMLATVLCACGFLAIKSYEYSEKFGHYEVWLKDGTRMVGHIEGSPWFWSTATLDEKNIETLLFELDEKHYAFGSQEHAYSGSAEHAAQDGEHAEAGAEEGHENGGGQEEHAEASGDAGHGGHQTVKIPREEIKRLSAFVPAHSTYFAIYFTLTGLHGLHVLGGALVLAFFLGPGSAMWKTDPERFTNRIEVGGLFWHFVDLVWIFLFPVLYLL